MTEFKLPAEVNFDDETWKQVPGYSRLYVTRTGRTGYFKDLQFTERTQYKMHNTKMHKRDETTYYLHARTIEDSTGRTIDKGVHICVALAWIGPCPADGKKYEVNHIDGVKVNNHVGNLEWMTRSQNVSHCFDIGQASSARRIIATNLETGEKKVYRSIKNFAELLGVHRNYVQDFVYKYSINPKDGWTYELEEREHKKDPTKYQAVEIAYKNYLTDTITFARSFQDAGRQTGIQVGTISAAIARCDPGECKVIREFAFQKLLPGMQWPILTKPEVEKSIERFDRVTKGNKQGRISQL